ncbi:amino acid ABC transporter substrate-binding protein [Clostridium fungisolvens]|uniref:L-cystine-binding protein TcyA n=1 Tax=Clostridium fungisolvens TaxID=1604897 RepID=A0A6V8SGJ9_9CLOT|nr:amino acid ABC transporter substrate-binding protein [Clostridium fungisolvens]GFP75702.1 L-cystine-binding protein TcyA [Clostridium fungisolvens]
MKKIALLMGALLIATVGLVGCTSKSNDTTKTTNLLESIKKQGTIKIGTEGTYAPYTFHDSTGKLVGFDVEIAEEVAKRLGVKPEFVETKWDGMLAGLDAKRFDIVVNQVGINEERKQKYDFSDPYVTSRAVLIVKSDNNTIKTFEDLKGKKAAQTLTSNLGKLAKENGAEIVTSDGFNQSIDLLLAGRADATINDSLSFYDLKKQKPDLAVKIAAEKKDADQNAILINKGNKELVDAINKALADMKSDGTYLKISNKYFNTDVSK